MSFPITSNKKETRLSHFHGETNEKKNSLKIQKHEYLVHTWSDKALKGTNCKSGIAKHLGIEGSLEITLTVPLKDHLLKYKYFKSTYNQSYGLKRLDRN